MKPGMKLKYDLAENEDHKFAIKQTVLTESSTVDVSRMPVEIQRWIRSLR